MRCAGRIGYDVDRSAQPSSGISLGEHHGVLANASPVEGLKFPSTDYKRNQIFSMIPLKAELDSLSKSGIEIK